MKYDNSHELMSIFESIVQKELDETYSGNYRFGKMREPSAADMAAWRNTHDEEFIHKRDTEKKPADSNKKDDKPELTNEETTSSTEYGEPAFDPDPADPYVFLSTIVKRYKPNVIEDLLKSFLVYCLVNKKSFIDIVRKNHGSAEAIRMAGELQETYDNIGGKHGPVSGMERTHTFNIGAAKYVDDTHSRGSGDSVDENEKKNDVFDKPSTGPDKYTSPENQKKADKELEDFFKNYDSKKSG